MALWTPTSAQLRTDEDPTKIPIEFDPRERRMTGVAAHGNVPFSVPFISQIVDNLWQGGCMNGLRLPHEIEHVVSLYPWERYTTHEGVKSELYVRMYDSHGQGFGQVEEIAAWVANRLADGPTLVHCQAGLNRSSLIAATVLVRHLGYTPKDAIALIREQRSPACLCNATFERYINGLTETPIDPLSTAA